MPTMEELLKKIEKLKTNGGLDLSLEEDLSIAIMNLISLEEHFFFTGEKTGKSDYFDLLQEVREIRKKLLARMIDKHEGETWCISKHLLAGTMRLVEVATKLQSSGKKEESREMFTMAYKLYSLFWGLRLKLINLEDVRNTAMVDGPMTKEELLKKLVDCCKE